MLYTKIFFSSNWTLSVFDILIHEINIHQRLRKACKREAGFNLAWIQESYIISTEWTCLPVELKTFLSIRAGIRGEGLWEIWNFFYVLSHLLANSHVICRLLDCLMNCEIESPQCNKHKDLQKWWKRALPTLHRY